VLREFGFHHGLKQLPQQEFALALELQFNLQQHLYLDLYELLLVLLFVDDQVLLEVKLFLYVSDVKSVYDELLLVGE
jgi:hypothetical protein